MQTRDDYFLSGPVRLRFRDEGEGTPVVFIHGWSVDLDVWEPQSAALAHSMRVIRFDRRGFGFSGGTPSLEADCGDLRELLDRLQLRQAVLVGTSQGARAALAFALRFPERVTGIVLDGPSDEIGGEGAGDKPDISLDEFREQVRTQGLDSFRRTWRQHPLMQLHSDDPDAQALLSRMLDRYPAHDLLDASARRAPPFGAAAVGRLHRPVLVVNGEFDTPVRLRAGDRLSRALPDAERFIVPGAGHLPNLDNAGAYDAALQAFFRRRILAAA
jgi:pimeloyl-ACP methyl ester carboxylesterase